MARAEIVKQLEDLKHDREYACKAFFFKSKEDQRALAEADVQALDAAIKALALPEPDKDDIVLMIMASELRAWLSGDASCRQYNRRLFVHNLGLLLSQTRRDVTSCSIHDEVVTIHYANGYARDVDVTADSYMAIIKDVLNAV